MLTSIDMMRRQLTFVGTSPKAKKNTLTKITEALRGHARASPAVRQGGSDHGGIARRGAFVLHRRRVTIPSRSPRLESLRRGRSRAALSR